MAQSVESLYNQMNDPSGLVWVAHSGTASVPHAVYVGKEANGQEVYVARAIVSGSNYLVVGKFVPGAGGSFPSDNFSPPAAFQVLTNPKQVQIKWALLEGPSIHPNAVKGGITVDKIRYIGRAKYEGNNVVGYLYNITPNDCRLYCSCSHSGTMNNITVCLSSAQYEILLAKPKPACQCEMYCRLPLNCSPSCPKKM